MWRMIAAAFVLTLSTGSPAKAGFFSGVELSEMCREESQVCVGYVMGVFDDLLLEDSDAPESRICVPSGITGGQIVRVVNAYLAELPDQLHWQANVLVRGAIITSLRCTS
ncbi:MAG TPA: Rap1a/Tai family immunity protein [Lysobacter sp.]|jgi:hypothetical protein|nr:Rap1a/Tai family immunity protein [Lysobacter sp.]